MQKMKKPFKDTKLSKILNKVKDIGLDVAPIVAKVGTGNISGAIKDTITILNGSDSAEALELLDELVIRKKEIELDYYRITTENVSKRWNSDMISDSWLSKNVRPITLLYLLLVFSILVICDSIENSFTVKIGWVNLIESLLITVVVAYFGGRSYEKGKKIK
jgi:hypothetical protein